MLYKIDYLFVADDPGDDYSTSATKENLNDALEYIDKLKSEGHTVTRLWVEVPLAEWKS